MSIKKNCLLIGKDGFCGSHLFQSSELKNRFHLTGTSRKGDLYLDLSILNSFQIIEDFCERSNPVYGVITAAIPDIEYCAKFPEDSFKINVEALQYLLKIFKKYSVTPIFFSTDFVLKPEKEFLLYKETDSCDPQTEYGKQKLKIENYIQTQFSRFLIFRTSKLMSKTKHPKNILFQVYDALKNQKDIHAFCDQWITPVFNEDIARIIAHPNLDRCNGIYHLATKKVYSRYELALFLNEHLKLNVDDKIHQSSLSEFKSIEVRPHFNTLNASKLEKELSFNFTEIENVKNLFL